MIHIYMDDLRKVPKGFALARSTEECLLMLRECEVDILSLDYDMGPGDYSGGEVARRIVLEGLFPEKSICTLQSVGRKEMYEILYTAKPEGMLLVNGPLSSDKLRDIAEETDLK